MKPLVYRKARRGRTQQVPQAMKLHLTKGDLVQVISGDDKGKQGKILRVYPKSGRLVIEGVNLVKRHRRATQNSEGGILTMPAPIHHSKAMLLDPKSGAPTRVRRQKDADGTVERIAVRSGQSIPRNR